MKKKLTLYIIILLCVSKFAVAHEHEEHGAHVHGVAKLNVAIDKNNVEISLEGPYHDFLGFEHSPENTEQNAAVKKMVDTLKMSDKLFITTVNANCKAMESSIKNNGIPAKGAEHDDLDADFKFTCDNPNNLKNINVNLFEKFPSLEKLEVQLVTPQSQKSIILNPKSTNITWK